MLFAFICNDKPGNLQLRLETRPEHVAYLNHLNDAGTLKFAGPFLDPEGKPNGSLMVVEAADKAAAETIATDDPFSKVGLFANVEIRPWNWVFNKPE